MENTGIPVGLAMALSMNPEAMKKFASLSDNQKREIIDGTHSVTSKTEMREYVEKILSMY